VPTYGLAGLTLRSDLVLPELVEGVTSTEPWVFELGTDGPDAVFEAIHQVATADGQPLLEILRDERRYLLRFAGAADFVVTASQRRISCVAGEGVGVSTVRHLLLDQVVPHVLALDGSLVLHASAVATTQGAIAFIGPSGFGKSSLAASFVAAGYALLADDFLPVNEDDDGFVAAASYPGLRLWPDSVAVFAHDGSSLMPVTEVSDKQRLATGPAPPRRAPLVAVVVLGDPGDAGDADFSLRPLPGRAGFMTLYAEAFRMERIGQERHLAEFERFARLAGSTKLLQLDYRRDYRLLPAVRAAILDAVAGG